MRDPSPDASALQNSGLGAFLYADVGTELNGSPLTILSMLARIHGDPWSEAAHLATLSRATAVEKLTQAMSEMPLAASSMAVARATAERLVLLLPEARISQSAAHGATPQAAPTNWMRLLLLACAVALALAFNRIQPHGISSSPTASTEQPGQSEP